MRTLQPCITPSTILRMVPLPQEGGLNMSYQNEKLLYSEKVFDGSLLRELAAEGRLRE